MKGISVTALQKLKRPILFGRQAFIAGEWVDATACLHVFDPATGELLGEVAACPPEAVATAVASAKAAFVKWRNMTPVSRGSILHAWAQGIRSNAEDLSIIMTAEQGKPVAEARSEIEYAASFLDWFASEGERAYGETIPSHLAGSRLTVEVQPVGVAAAVTPWNFPCAMITRKTSAALAAGCTMIVKPAPETPFSALALARLAQEAGMPRGVFQVLTGEAAPLTQRLLQHTEVRAFSFTGSTQIGRLLLGQAADTVKKVSLELGGHAPFIVFDDSQISAAVSGCMKAKFATSGQDCLAANRIYVQRGSYDAFVSAFANATDRLTVGHGLQPGVDIGPMTRDTVARKCREQIADAASAGARIVTTRTNEELLGNFVTPTVLADVSDEMLIAREETFGPVAAILPFDTEEEVISRANSTEMGLAAYVYTSDLGRAMRLSDRLEYGMVAINTASFTGPPIPFGGWKQSGLGREGSRHGLMEYMETKYVCIGNYAA
ncbi:succinate semialdehyde dehydrogenase [Paraburkholderia sp. BL6665CI2N2]|uniref:NAD-dependent succinate-semialdehyde dehydrogenase n=1 Tax=Paraburkholderia sp. BL6665CI2N2 TaxID=1938806 RepID=UPI0010649965|nr:NAD-dependent succinate-semialdehyde dehydrogenase [Paraburkholderia sp. BL6665CI2N2]TDY17099.1 succinate semialdehyde dehydrogenase [Paraburkholderia sp. BL6665CI2N2]